MSIDYGKIAKDVENGFIEPNYQEQKIKYVSDKAMADVTVSSRHTMGDYLLIGITALKRSISGKSGELSVFNERKVKTATIGVATGWHAPLRKAEVDSEIFIQMYEPIEEIYHHLYNGKSPVAGIGLSISTALMLEFSEIGNGIPEEIMTAMKFEHFDDVDMAQKDAFLLIKKMTAASVAGSYYAMINGED